MAAAPNRSGLRVSAKQYIPLAKSKKNEPAAPLILGKDYHIENGLYVFTRAYHLKRGYCCGSGCRHCPWKNCSAADKPTE
ncbi:MAG: DUF5522 domain-containing protein [Bacteroidota bacterium]